VVRGPAAVLAALAAAFAWFLLAPSLPEIHHGDLALLVAAALGLAFVAACASAVVPLAGAPLALALVLPGAGLLAGALDAANVGAAATPIEALLFASAGVLFVVALGSPALALALPVVVAAIDAASLFGADSARFVAEAAPAPGDLLTLEIPDLGSGLSAARLGIADVVFFAVFAAFAQRLGMRPVATAAGMAVALIAAFALGLWLDRAIPAVPLMAAAYFLVNADRLPALFRQAGRG
jgi:hypothetical protein